MKRPPAIVVTLIHIAGPLKGQEQVFYEDVIRIGRRSSCHVRFPADLTIISRDHADIIRDGNQFKLIDHSANGTLVNGKPVKEIVLKEGDVMTFADGGPKVSFLSEIKEAPSQVESRAQQYSAPGPGPAPGGGTAAPMGGARQPYPSGYKAEQEIRAAAPSAYGPMGNTPIDRRVIEQVAEAPSQKANVPLTIQYGPTIRSFRELPVTIGKNPRSNFVLNHPEIFDQHAQIFFTQSQYWIKDLAGSRSIRINQQPMIAPVPLRVNDIIALSPHGPVFVFLGEGRLAEVAQEEEKPSGFQERNRGEMPHEVQKKNDGGFFSKVKKRFT